MCIIEVPNTIGNYTLLNELDSYFRLSLVIITNKEFNNDKMIELQNLFTTKDTAIIIKNEGNIKISCSYKFFFSLFKIKLFSYQKDNKKFYSNNQEYDIGIYNYIDSILGLNNLPFCKHNAIFLPDIKLNIDTERDKALGIYTERDYNDRDDKNRDLVKFTPLSLGKLYNFPLLYYGRNQTIALIELGGGYKQSDISYYFKYLKLSPVPKIFNVYVDGATNNPGNTIDSVEVVLDIEIAGAIANCATIVVYFAPNTARGFYNAVHAAINDTKYNPNIISISWGFAENLWPLDVINSFNGLLATAAAKGINVFCASGDQGSNNGQNVPVTDFPASSPHVIACGGTRVDSNGSSIRDETVWNNYPKNPNTNSATGGGISKIFSKLAYQNNVQTNTNMRCVPDISANADPKTGYLIFINNGYGICGGTSCVAPLMAGLTARLNEKNKSSIGFLNNKLYTNDVCALIKKGNNGAYSANKDGSYSLTCGLGRINGAIAINKL